MRSRTFIFKSFGVPLLSTFCCISSWGIKTITWNFTWNDNIVFLTSDPPTIKYQVKKCVQSILVLLCTSFATIRTISFTIPAPFIFLSFLSLQYSNNLSTHSTLFIYFFYRYPNIPILLFHSYQAFHHHFNPFSTFSHTLQSFFTRLLTFPLFIRIPPPCSLLCFY